MPEAMIARSPLAGRRIAIAMGGHLSTCPRMVKAADALAHEGCDVRVVSALLTRERSETDAAIAGSRRWRWRPVDVRPQTAPLAYRWTGARRRAAEMLARLLGPTATPPAVALRAASRLHDELVRALVEEPATLVYGGTGGALAAAAESAERLRVPFAIDLEDFHPAEQEGPGAAMANHIAKSLVELVLPRAVFATTAGQAMADEYAARFRRTPIVIDNTMPLPSTPPPFEISAGRALKFYWFSQTIGPGRGLEEAVRAIGASGIPAELFLRGRDAGGYTETLRGLAGREAPHLTLAQLPIVPPDALIQESRGFDVGLAVEMSLVRNHEIALSNKALSYPLAGLALVMTNTAGQRALAADLGEAALTFSPRDPQALVSGLQRWHMDRGALGAAKRRAWERARLRWHWEHQDRQRLIDAVSGALA